MTALKTLLLTSAAVLPALLSSCSKDDDDTISMGEVSRGIEKVMTIQGKDTIFVDAVDLGLPSELLWATCNIGANQPQESGHFFAWGETETKTDYNYATYAHSQGDDFTFTKYAPKTVDGKRNERLAPDFDGDDKSKLEKADDAASVTYGDGWFMPTQRDFDELIYRTTKRYGKLNGVPGILFTSNMPGYQDRSIFLPMAGRKDYDRTFNEGSYGFYWSADRYGTTEAHILWLDYTVKVPNVTDDTRERYLGLPVRPVTYGSDE